MRERKGFRQVLVDLEDLFLGTAPARTADLLAAHEAEPWDLLAGDPMALGTRFAAERLGCRWASVSPIAVWPPGTGSRPRAWASPRAAAWRAGRATPSCAPRRMPAPAC
jgi:hypothetical protein